MFIIAMPQLKECGESQSHYWYCPPVCTVASMIGCYACQHWCSIAEETLLTKDYMCEYTATLNTRRYVLKVRNFMHLYRIRENFQTSNFRITAKWNISNGFIFEFPSHPPREKLRWRLSWRVKVSSLTCSSIESMVRGYHAYLYRRAWKASIGEKLTCQKERGYLADPFKHTGNFQIGFIFVWLLVVWIIRK